MVTSTAHHIGKQLRQRRAILHMSQEALGLQLGGLTQQAISKMERGGEISGSQLLELSRILNVPVSYFFDGLETEGMVGFERPPQGKAYSPAAHSAT